MVIRMNAVFLFQLLTTPLLIIVILHLHGRVGRLSHDLEIALKSLELKSMDLARAYDQLVQGSEKDPWEAQKVQIQKMAALGKIMSGIAHEITNPLGVILGFAQSAVRNMKEEDPVFHAMKSIEREAGRCKNILHTLLHFSGLQNGGRRSCSLNSVVETALVMVEPYTKTKSVELLKELSQDLPEVTVSPTQIQQVLINLTTNAADAMPNGGTLVVRTFKAFEKGGAFVELQVQDSGLGIPKEIQGKIFEPYFTTKGEGHGAGIGLSLVYEIVKQHGGTIRVESQPSEGSLFRILLPLGDVNDSGRSRT